MDTNMKNMASQAAQSAKSFLGDAKDMLKDGLDTAKEKAQQVAADAQTPEGREQLKNKATDIFDTLKDKTADALRAGAKGARKLADKIDN